MTRFQYELAQTFWAASIVACTATGAYGFSAWSNHWWPDHPLPNTRMAGDAQKQDIERRWEAWHTEVAARTTAIERNGISAPAAASLSLGSIAGVIVSLFMVCGCSCAAGEMRAKEAWR